jgi:hypothetical protein
VDSCLQELLHGCCGHANLTIWFFSKHPEDRSGTG